MASLYDPVRGPFLKHAFAKAVVKGEDAWLQQRNLAVRSKDGTPAVEANIFGVFDGHGGKQAATFAARNMASHVLKDFAAVCSSSMDSGSQDLAGAEVPLHRSGSSLSEWQSSREAEDLIPAQLKECKSLSADSWEAWHAQDAFVDALPQVLRSSFSGVHDDFLAVTKVSGTTATVAAFVGWELIVANVGDSLAFLDTGSEVIQVSGNHRLDANKAEQQRLKARGRDVSRSQVGPKAVGPLRVWPGGLAMGRTLGDREAGEAVLSEPEVRQVTLPETGARLIIASDGLWDAVQPKTAAHHVRNLAASKAATELVQVAMKHKGGRDDVTVIVVDALSSSEDRLPALLQKTGSGATQGSTAPAHTVAVTKPLELQEGNRPWYPLEWDLRLAAVETVYGSPTKKADDPDASSEVSDETAFLDVASSLSSNAAASGNEADAMEVPSTLGSNEQAENAGDDDSWVPVKAKRHAVVVGSPGSESSWPGVPQAKAKRQEEASHPQQLAEQSGKGHQQRPVEARAAAQPSEQRGPRTRDPRRSRQFANNQARNAQSSAAGEQPQRRQPNRSRNNGQRNSRPQDGWGMGSIAEDATAGQGSQGIPALNAKGIKAVHAVQGCMSYAGSSLNATRGLLPDVTTSAAPPGERAGSVDVGPRDHGPSHMQAGNRSALHHQQLLAPAAPAAPPLPGIAAEGMWGEIAPPLVSQNTSQGSVTLQPRAYDAAIPVLQFGGAARFAADGSDLRSPSRPKGAPSTGASSRQRHNNRRQAGRTGRSRARPEGTDLHASG